MEWQSYQDSLCPGCHLPRNETFADPPSDWTLTRGHWEDRYDVRVMTCAACAALQRKAQSSNGHRGLSAGLYFAVDAPYFED